LSRYASIFIADKHEIDFADVSVMFDSEMLIELDDCFD